MLLSGAVALLTATSFYAIAQIAGGATPLAPSTLTPPPMYPGVPVPANQADSIMMPFPVQQTVPATYEDLMEDQFAADLATPSNITTVAEFDPVTGFYVIRTKLGDTEITTPFMLSKSSMTTGSFASHFRNTIRKRIRNLKTTSRRSRSIFST